MSSLYLIYQWFWKRSAGRACECPFPYIRISDLLNGFSQAELKCQYILHKRDGKRKEDLMEWQSEKESLKERKCRWIGSVCVVQMTHCMCSFSTLSSRLSFRMFSVFPVQIVLAKSIKVSQMKWWSVYGILIFTHSNGWMSSSSLSLFCSSVASSVCFSADYRSIWVRNAWL